MFYDYQVLGYTETGTLIYTGCGRIFLLPFDKPPGDGNE